MKTLALYLLQVIIVSGILYAYYHFVLRNKKFHQYNRFYLLGSLLIALLVPCLNIPVYFSANQEKSSTVLRTLRVFYSTSGYTTTASPTVPVSSRILINWENLLTAAYLIIAFVFFLKLILSLKRINSLIRSYPAEELEGIYFVNTNEPGTPFSFFRWLFWDSKIELQSEKGQQIFRHEIFHIQQKHTWDLVLMETITTICWLNPFFHLMKKELSTIHEFLADQYAVNEERKWDYAELLLMQALRTRQVLVNPFFNNQIKRRIAMITTSTKPGYQYLRKIMVLPVAAITIALVAFSYKTKEVKKKSLLNEITYPYSVEDTPKRKAIIFFNKDSIIGKSDQIIFDPPLTQLYKSRFKDMLIVVNGERKPYTFLKDHLISAELTKVYDKNNAAAIALYGKDAANGVIVFEKATIAPASVDDQPTNTLDSQKADKTTIKNSSATKAGTDFRVNTYASGSEIHVEGNLQLSPDFSLRVESMTIKYPKRLEEMETPFEPELFIVNGERFSRNQAAARFNGAIIKSATATVIEENNEEAIRKYGWMAQKGVFEIKSATIVKSGPTPTVLAQEDENRMFEKVEIEAEFPGGKKAWDAYLQKTVNAEIAARNGAPEKVYTVSIEFIVHPDGTISDIKALTNHGHGMEQEVIKAITNSPKWISAIQNGRKVAAFKKVNYTFTVAADQSSKIPTISLRELRQPDMNRLLGLSDAYKVISFKFTIDKDDDSIVETSNTGKHFSDITRKLLDETKAGHLITFEEIRVEAEGRQRKMPSKVYLLVD
jgi:hypothetical protein